MNVLVIDLETTGEAPPAEVIEVGGWLLEHRTGDILPILDDLCRSEAHIPPEISAVHHIVAEDLAGAERTFEEMLKPYCDDPNIDIYAAHFAKFEQQWVTELFTGTRPWICTYKCAMRAWPHLLKFNNQALRYALDNYQVKREYCNTAHRAAPDAFVTALTLKKLTHEHSLDTLIEWTREPTRYPRMTFGKHNGTAWSQVPRDYLAWMLRQSDMDPDQKYCARLALDGVLK